MKRLPESQHNMIRLWILGGVDAIGKHSTRTVDALIRIGFLDHRDGPTDRARAYVDYHERQSFKIEQ